jgi:GT2 family glycosyltransferase
MANNAVCVSIIVVGTNEKKDLENCLNSIANSETSYGVETIVVDNASTDGTSEMVKNHFGKAILIRNEEKKGYIFSNNFAMKRASGEYILLLNSDIELEKNTIQHMVDFMECNPSAAVSAPRLTFDDGTLQLTCRRFHTYPACLIFFAGLR